MRVKKFILSKLFFVIFIISFIVFFSGNIIEVSAINSCADGQKIMKLSTTLNKGALWDKPTTNYIDICYNDLFGKDYDYDAITTDPHLCKFTDISTNEVMLLNGEIDALGFVSYANDNIVLIKYDINGDNKVDATDIQLSINCALGLDDPLCVTAAKLFVDSNENPPVVDANDVQTMINCALGLGEECVGGLYPSFVIDNAAEFIYDLYDTDTLDNNHEFDAADIQVSINCALDLPGDAACTDTDGNGYAQADINADGRVDSTDTQLMINYALIGNPDPLALNLQRVCYGDLVCNVRDGTNCQSNEKLIVSLNQRRNGAIYKDATGPIKICCKSPQNLIGNEICDNRIDDDNDGLIDYSDTLDCPVLTCTSQGKIVKYALPGTGPGAPWTPQSLFQNYKGCCLFNQCYSGNPTNGGCFNNGNNYITTMRGEITCSIFTPPIGPSGPPRWCKKTFALIDGSGKCLCPSGTKQCNNECIPESNICQFTECGNDPLVCEFGDSCSCLECNNLIVGGGGACSQYECNPDTNLCNICPNGEQLCADNTCKINCPMVGGGEPQSCGDFNNQPDCENLNLWTNNILSNIQDRTGLEGDFCLDNSIITTQSGCEVRGNCGCQWNTNAALCEGKFNLVAINPNEPVCSSLSPLNSNCLITYNYTALVACETNNEYPLSWKSRWAETGAESPENGCISGSTILACPEKTILPFFGFFNLLISMAMIIGIYLFLKRR